MEYIKYHFEEIESTNDFAKEKAKSETNNFLVTADYQTKGRGRKGRQFVSNKNSGLYLSVAVKLDIVPEKITNVTTYTAVCTARAIEKFTCLKAEIKWVNDIYVNGKKLCGILTEGVFKNGQIDFIIIGIGINILKQNFPDEIKNIATSIEDECGLKLKTEDLINAILNELGDYKMDNYMEEYKNRSFIIGKEVTVLAPDKSYPAVAIDIDDDGHLVVDCDGEIKVLSSGDVSVNKI